MCVCMCVWGSRDLMGFPAQQNAPSPLPPPQHVLARARPNTHSPYRSDRQPQGHSSDGWTHPGVFYCWPMLSSAFEEQTSIIVETQRRERENMRGE